VFVAARSNAVESFVLADLQCSAIVMAGLVPAIHVFLFSGQQKDVDARHEAGHDERLDGKPCRISH
jgi:hypothetical protein